jgi:hypothetical protein
VTIESLNCAIHHGKQGRCAMADDEALKPQDFPVHTDQKQIVKNDGKAIAEARTKKTAEDIAERLNAEEDRREEDRWSA